ncbi:MAG: hypothetical protein ACRBBN_05850 [Methyloligellaceae bacterium]
MSKVKSDADVAAEYTVNSLALFLLIAFPVFVALTFLQIRIVEFEWSNVHSLSYAVENTLRHYLFP